jgi:plastocyanin
VNTQSVPTTERPRGRPRWSDLAALGFVFAGAGPLFLLAAVVAWGVDTGGENIFFAVTSAVSFLTAFVIWRFGRCARIAGYVVGLMMLMSLWWTIYFLFTGPASFFEFMAGLLILPGILLALAGLGTASFAMSAGRLDTPGQQPKVIRVALGLVALAAVVSGLLTATSRSSVADTSAATSRVVMKDYSYSPDRIDVAGGSTILLRNDDPFVHTFTVDALDLDEQVGIGSETLIRIPAKPGTYILYCKPHTSSPEEPSEDDMAATIRVT